MPDPLTCRAVRLMAAQQCPPIGTAPSVLGAIRTIISPDLAAGITALA